LTGLAVDAAVRIQPLGAREQTGAVCARLADGSERGLRALDAVLVDTADPTRRPLR
jgi:hypothetical protein